MYLEKAGEFDLSTGGVADSVTGVQIVPQYELKVQAPVMH
jgi:hypothetical protein